MSLAFLKDYKIDEEARKVLIIGLEGYLINIFCDNILPLSKYPRVQKTFYDPLPQCPSNSLKFITCQDSLVTAFEVGGSRLTAPKLRALMASLAASYIIFVVDAAEDGLETEIVEECHRACEFSNNPATLHIVIIAFDKNNLQEISEEYLQRLFARECNTKRAPGSIHYSTCHIVSRESIDSLRDNLTCLIWPLQGLRSAGSTTCTRNKLVAFRRINYKLFLSYVQNWFTNDSLSATARR